MILTGPPLRPQRPPDAARHQRHSPAHQDGDIRTIQLDPARSGHVWNHIERNDDDWKARAMAEPTPQHHLPLPVIRLSAPEAFVVVIGPREEGGEEVA